MTVCVLGLGYIGLPLALLLADRGATVTGFDVDPLKLKLLREKKLPFTENGLEELFISVQKKGTFKTATKVPVADCYVVAVPTPQREHRSDLSYVLKSLEFINPKYKKDSLIILESTVGPSDCESKIIPELEKWGMPVNFAHCPERAIPGSTLEEMVHNDRVIGGNTPAAAKAAKKVYKTFVTGSISLTTPNQAATVKTMENTFRAVNIALANEFAQIATELDLDVWEAISLANHHPRVSIHQPGPGVGGHCIPIDPWFFVGESSKTKLIKTSLQINDNMPQVIANQVLKIVKKHRLTQPRIGILGYAYKKNIDDTRETPARELVEAFKKIGAVKLNDPYLKSVEGVDLLDIKGLLQSSDVIVLATDHDIYRDIIFKNYPNIAFVYDTRNIFNSSNFTDSKTTLYTLGKGR